jgi:hypothetical protein
MVFSDRFGFSFVTVATVRQSEPEQRAFTARVVDFVKTLFGADVEEVKAHEPNCF